MAKQLSKSIIQTILTQIPTQLFGIASGIFITRILTTENRGVYAILMANVNLFITLFGFSMTTVIIYFLASKKLEIKQVFGLNFLAFGSMLLISLLVISFLYFSNHIDLLFLDAFSSQIAVWFFLYLSITFINSMYSGIFQSQKEFGIVNQVSFLNSIFNILLYGGLFVIHIYEFYAVSLNNVLIISVFVLLINLFQWNYHFYRNYSFEISFKINYKKHLKDLVNYLGLAHLSNVINFFNNRIVLWVLAFYLDNFQIGIFSVAMGLSQILSFISSPLSQVLLPYLTSGNQQERDQLFVIFSKMHFTLILIISVIGLSISPFLIPLLYGQQYAASIYPFFIMIIGFLFNNQSGVMASYMFSSNKVVVNLYATIIGFISTIFFYFYLIKTYGIIGAAISTTLTYTVIFSFVYLMLLRSLKNHGRNFLFLSRKDVKILIQKLKNRNLKNE